MQATLGLVHGLDYLATYFLLGLLIFVYGVAPAGGPPAEKLIDQHQRWLRILVSLSFASSLLWLLFSSADMADGWDPSGLRQAITETRFGHLWGMRVGLLFLLTIGWKQFSKLGPTLIVPLLGLPIISSLTGHAAAGDGAVVLSVVADVLHSLAVATWSGGLWGLYLWLGKRAASLTTSSDVSLKLVTRFSHFAMISTAAIAGTGLYMAYRAGISPWQPWATRYGMLVLVKLILFSAALAAASINQFVHMKKAQEAGEKLFVKEIRREVRLEFVLVVFVFLVAGFLARTDLPGS